MPEAYIVEAVRTPVGRRNGGLAKVHPADLGAHPIREVVARTGIDPGGRRGRRLRLPRHDRRAGRRHRPHGVALAAGLPESVPGVTIDRQCGSSQQAVSFAAQAVMAGTADVVLAGGVQMMSRYPILSSFAAGEPFGADRPVDRLRGLARPATATRRSPSSAPPR